MEIPKHLYNWLYEIDVLKLKANLKANTLDSLTVQSFENGQNFQPIVKHLNQVKNKLDRLSTPMPELNTLRDANSPSAKLYNWNIVIQALSMLGVTISQDTKNLILAGDRLMIIEVIEIIYQAEKKFARRSSSTKQLVPEVVAPPAPPGSLFLEELTADKSLDQTSNCLEFILLCCCQNFSLKPKQAAGLLTQNNKYLSLIITKGLKGEHDPVLCWYQSIYTYTNTLIKLIDTQSDEEPITFVLNALKPGLVAKELEVVQWSFRLMSKIFLELSDIGKLRKAWEWFISDSGGLESTLMSCKKYGDEVSSQAVDLLVYISEFNLKELFTTHISTYLPVGDYFQLITQLLPHLLESASTKQEIITTGIINHWIEMAVREVDGSSILSSAYRMNGLLFLSDLWIYFYEMIEDNDSLANSILALIKKSGRLDSFCIKLHVISLLFKLLEFMADKKSHYAIIIYRTLTFMLAENYINSDIREIIQSNFKDLLNSLPSIPVSLLVDPLIKRFASAENYYHPFDIDFLVSISKHPRLSLKHAIQIVDTVSKIYLLDTIYTKSAGVAFTYLASRFIDTDAMQDFLHKFSKLVMNMIAQIEYEMHAKIEQPSLASAFDLELAQSINKQRRIQGINMVIWILELEESQLNNRVINEALEIITSFKKTSKYESTGILYILKLLGDPNELIMQYLSDKEPKRDIENLEVVPYEEKEEDETLNEPFENSFIREEEEAQARQTSIMELQNALVAVEKKTVEKKTNFPWDRAAADIEKAKIKRIERDQKIRGEEQQKSKQLNFHAKKINKHLQIRQIEQGNLKSTPEELMFKEGAIQKYISKPEDYIPKQFSDAEAQDSEMVNLILRKYSRLFKILFSKYTGTGFITKNHSKSTIDWLTERKEKMTESEYIKLLRDHSILDTLITKEQVRGIMKSFCQKVLKQSELNTTDYEGFKGLFCQTAYFIYSSDPYDLSHLPAVLSVIQLIDFMRDVYRKNKLNTEMFEDDPGTGDKDIVRRLNTLLMNDSNTPLPDGYKRIVDKDIEIKYEIPEQLDINSSYKDCIEILDEVLFSNIGVHIIEPMVELKTYYKAKGIAPKKNRIELPPIYERPPNLVKNKLKEDASQSPTVVVKSMNLTPIMKFEIAQAPNEMKETMQECAIVLEDILRSVQLKLGRVISRAPKKTEEIKTQDPLEEQKIRKAEEKRRLRKKQMEEELRKAKEEREVIIKKKEEELIKDKIIEEKRKKALEAKLQGEREEKQKQLKDWKEKREEEERKTKEKQMENKTKSEEKNKKFYEDADKKKQQLQEWLNAKQIEEFKKKQEEDKLKQEQALVKKQLSKDRKKHLELPSKKEEYKLDVLKQGVLSDKSSNRSKESPVIPRSPDLLSSLAAKESPKLSSSKVPESTKLNSKAKSSAVEAKDEEDSDREMLSKIEDVLIN